jgi:hypothetical protein
MVVLLWVQAVERAVEVVSGDSNLLQWVTLLASGGSGAGVLKLLFSHGKFVGRMDEFRENTNKTLDALPCRHGEACYLRRGDQ